MVPVAAEEAGRLLASVNAFLNFTSAAFLVAGLVFIRTRNVRRHRLAMTGAISASALFLVLYLTRIKLTGIHQFAGEGWARGIYFAILFSHISLAVLVVPLVLRLLWLIRQGRFKAHAQLARWGYPVWMYVSVTGLVVYLLLYHVYGYTS